jgi:hypothetical protein
MRIRDDSQFHDLPGLFRMSGLNYILFSPKHKDFLLLPPFPPGGVPKAHSLSGREDAAGPFLSSAPGPGNSSGILNEN